MPTRLLFLLPLLLAACAPAATSAPPREVSTADYTPVEASALVSPPAAASVPPASTTSVLDAYNAANRSSRTGVPDRFPGVLGTTLSAPPAVAAPLTSGRFGKEPNVGYVGYTGALGFSEHEAAIGAELLHLVKTMSAVPYDPAVSRASYLEFAALSRRLVSGATDQLKDIGTAIRAGSIQYYLFRFPGVERSYALGLQLALSSVRNYPSYTNSAYEIKYRTDLNTAQFEYDVANRLIDYHSHFLDYVRAAIKDTETLCGLQKFSCLAETN